MSKGYYQKSRRAVTDVELAQAQAFAVYEYWISSMFPAALAREPGLRGAEWERRNPFASFIGVSDAQKKRAILRVVK